MDFFEDQLVAESYDWKALVREYMFGGKEPLFSSLVSGRECSFSFSPLPFHRLFFSEKGRKGIGFQLVL